MQSDQHFFPGTAVPPLAKQAGYSYMHVPAMSPFAGVLPPAANHFKPTHSVEFQPSDVCPKNFIIFDQTDHRSQIMFHPAIANKLAAPPNFLSTCIQENFDRRYVNGVENEVSSAYREDSDDIDALLSLEDKDFEEYEEDEVSTARTCGNYGSNSPDSYSTDGCKPWKDSFPTSTQKSSGSSSSCNSQRKRQKMKKMVNVLRGIVPGGDQMSTVTVLDEAVRYLKSLKVEAQKLELGNLNE